MPRRLSIFWIWFFFHIVTIFIFSTKQFSLLKNKINNITKKLYEYQSIKIDKKDEKNVGSKKFRLNSKKTCTHKNSNKKGNKNKIYKKSSINNSNINLKAKKNNKKNKVNKKEYIDEEINGFSYKRAISYDKRNYCQYYASLLKTNHNLISALFNSNDYNSGIIKIDLFFIGFTNDYTVNALFYNDDTMHKIYVSKGDFDLVTQIPIAALSTIITMILNFPLNFLALTNDAIINFKESNIKDNILIKAKNLKNILIVKFVLYFFISFLFLLFFWYYISMFCVVYKNTQIHLLKDILMSFGFSLIVPFGIYLFPGIFRISALSNASKNRECLYNFSKFLQSFWKYMIKFKIIINYIYYIYLL